MNFHGIYLTDNLWASWSGLTYLLHYTFKVTWFVTQTSSGVTVTYCKISIKLSSAFKPMFILQKAFEDIIDRSEKVEIYNLKVS